MIGALVMLAAATPVPPVATLNERPPFGRSIPASSEPGAPRLTGIVTTPDGPLASLKDSASGLAAWVSVGGSFAGWTLEAVSDDLRSAALRRDGKSTTIFLPKPGAQPNAAAPCVTPSPYTRPEHAQSRPPAPPPPEETIRRQRLRVPQR